MNKWLQTPNVLAGATVNMRTAKVKGIWLNFIGTAQAAQTVVFADFGNIIVTRNGVPIVSVNPAELDLANSIEFSPRFNASAIGAAFNLAVYVPFYDEYNNDKNAVPFTAGDAISIGACNPVAVLACTCEIDLDEEDLPYVYLPYIYTHAIPILGLAHNVQLPVSNLYKIWLGQATVTDANQVVITKDGKQIFANSYANAVLETNAKGKNPVAVATMAILRFGNIGNIAGKFIRLQRSRLGRCSKLHYLRGRFQSTLNNNFQCRTVTYILLKKLI